MSHEEHILDESDLFLAALPANNLSHTKPGIELSSKSSIHEELQRKLNLNAWSSINMNINRA